MNTTLVLCDYCGEPIELPVEQDRTLDRYADILGERVVVHCSQCFARLNGLTR